MTTWPLRQQPVALMTATKPGACPCTDNSPVAGIGAVKVVLQDFKHRRRVVPARPRMWRAH